MIKKYKALKLIFLVSVVLSMLSIVLAFTTEKDIPSSKPEENRFTKIVLAEKLDEPMELAFLGGGKVLFIERKGNVKIYDPQSKKVKIVGNIPVSTKYTDKQGKQTEAEDGLLGLALDPNFEQNRWIYLYYSPAGNDPKNILTRFEFRDDKLIEESKKVILEVPVQREQCCHTGGSIAFDAKGNLYVSTGDNTSPRATGYAPIDERPGRAPWDAQKSSGNTNDLRGKILRIHPEADGSYTIPEGNLFPKGTPKTRPEIYTMGHRNPYRISVDKKTGFLYWGDVGPDAGRDSVGRGPQAEDEFNQARKAGNFGWPYFVGNNKAYWEYDFASKRSGEQFNPLKPINNSPNNTGLTELPPAQKAMIWYPPTESVLFPQLGVGGRSAMAGPVFRKENFKNTKNTFPDYYEGKLFLYEWMRGWIMAVTLDEDGNYLKMERFLPSYKFSNPIELEFSPDGEMYMLEYGEGWFQGNDDARLVKIEYNGGNRKPFVELTADKKIGATPLTVSFSSAGTKDADNDPLKFEWKILSKTGEVVKTVNEPNITHTFTTPGLYKVQLTATDNKGEKSEASTEITAGNDAPKVSFEKQGNRSFYFPGETFNYNVSVQDKEDGSLENGKILPSQVAVTIDYLKEGFDKVEIAAGHKFADESATISRGKKLMEGSDCRACHAIDKKSVGPEYNLVAQKYKGDPMGLVKLTNKIINGGGGVWGDAVMPAHPQLSEEDAKEMVRYILTLGDIKKEAVAMPVKGTFNATIPDEPNTQGAYILRAAYTDKGANGLPPAKSEEVLVLRNPKVSASTADTFEKVTKFKPAPNMEIVIVNGSGSYIGFDQVDLTDINRIEFTVTAPKHQLDAAGGKIEVRLGSPTGTLLGTSEKISPTDDPKNPYAPQIVGTNIAPIKGMKKIYYVFTHEEANVNRSLFVVAQLEYKK